MDFCKELDLELNGEIDLLITKTCDAGGFLLYTLHNDSEREIIKIFKDYLMRWFEVQSLREKIPLPYPLIKTWVQVCKKTVILNLIFDYKNRLSYLVFIIYTDTI